jgi:hypothetical protein
MRKSRKSASVAPGEGGGRLLLHLGPGLRQAIESDEVYFVEAKDDDTEVRTRAARVLRDVRPIGVLAAPFLRPPAGGAGGPDAVGAKRACCYP